jgi:ribosomal protein L32
MKCPHCGNESERNDVCSRCGEKIEAPEQTIEVEYKEFKVSEFMEIRKKRLNSGKGTEEPLAGEAGKRGKEYRTARDAGIPAARVEGKRRMFFIAVMVLIILAVITGAYYLLRFLHH